MKDRCAGQNCGKRIRCAVHMIGTGQLVQYKPRQCKVFVSLTPAQAAQVTREQKLRANLSSRVPR